MKKIISTIMSILLILQMSPVSAYADALEVLSLKSNKEQIVVKSNPDEEKNNTILKGPYEFKIQRDYDQKIRFELNAPDETVGLKFTIEAENGTADDLAFQLAKNQVFIDKNNNYIEASFHAQDAQKRQYVFYLNMFKNGDFSERARVLVTVVHPGFDIDIKEVNENPVTMSKTYEITNYGSTISDFSVHLEGDGALSLVEGVEHYRFGKDEKLQITVLPDFNEKQEIRGNIVMEGGVKKSKKFAVEFQEADDSKKIDISKYLNLRDLLSEESIENAEGLIDEYTKEMEETFKLHEQTSKIDLSKKEFYYEGSLPNAGDIKIKLSTEDDGFEGVKVGSPKLNFENGEYVLREVVQIPIEDLEKLLGTSVGQDGKSDTNRKESEEGKSESSATGSSSVSFRKASKYKLATSVASGDIIKNTINVYKSTSGTKKAIEDLFNSDNNWVEKSKAISGAIDDSAGMIEDGSKFIHEVIGIEEYVPSKAISNIAKIGKVAKVANVAFEMKDTYDYFQSDASEADKMAYGLLTIGSLSLMVGGSLATGPVGVVAMFALGLALEEVKGLYKQKAKIVKQQRYRHRQCINRRKLIARVYVQPPSYAKNLIGADFSSLVMKPTGIPWYDEYFSYTFNGKRKGDKTKLVDGKKFIEIDHNEIKNGVNEFVQENTYTNPGSLVLQTDINFIQTYEVTGSLKLRIPQDMTVEEWMDYANRDYKIDFPKPDLAVDATSLSIGYEEYQEKAFIGQEAKMLIRVANEGTEACMGKVQLIRSGDNKVVFEQEEVEFLRLSTKSFETSYTPESQNEEFKLLVETKSNELNKNNNEFTFVQEYYENPGEGPQILVQPNDMERVVANITKDLLVEVKTKNKTPIRRVDMRLNGGSIVLNNREDQLETGSNAYYAKTKFKEGENTLQIIAEDYFGNETSKDIRVQGFVETWTLKSDFFRDNQFEMQVGEKLSLYNDRGANIGFYMENENRDRKYIGWDGIRRLELTSSEQGVVSIENALVAKTAGTSNVTINYNDPDLGLVSMIVQVNVKENLPNVAIISGDIIKDLLVYINGHNHWQFEKAIRIIANEKGDASRGLNDYRFEKTDDNKLIIRSRENLSNKTLIVKGEATLYKVPLNENEINLDNLTLYQIDFSTNTGDIQSIHFLDTDLHNESSSFYYFSGHSDNISLRTTEGRYQVIVNVNVGNIEKSITYQDQLLNQNKRFEIQIDDSVQVEKGSLVLSLPTGVSVTQLSLQSQEVGINLSQISNNVVELPVGKYLYAELRIQIGGELYSLWNSKTFNIRAGENTEFSVDNNFGITIEAENKELFGGEHLRLRLSAQDRYGNSIGPVKVPIYWRNIETGDIIKIEKRIFGESVIQLTAPNIAGTYELFVDSNYKQENNSVPNPNPIPKPNPEVNEKPKDNSSDSTQNIVSWGNERSTVRPDNERKEDTSKDLEKMSEKNNDEKDNFLAKLTIGSKEYQILKEGRLENVKADVAPMISQGRTMLPARMIAELLNIKVEFNNLTKTAKFIYLKDSRENIVELQFGKKVMKVNGQEKALSANIIQINGRIMLPLSDIQKALNELGLDIGIQWNSNTKQVILK